MTDDDSEFYPTSVKRSPTVTEEAEEQLGGPLEESDADLAGVQTCDVKPDDHLEADTVLVNPSDGSSTPLVNEPLPEHPVSVSFVVDLGDVPTTGDERMVMAADVLKALERSLDELSGDLDPDKVKAYTDQLQRMLSDGITLYNIMRGRWAINKEFKVGDRVYFDYFGVRHMGDVVTIGKSKVLISFMKYNKDHPNEGGVETKTWRRREQVSRP